MSTHYYKEIALNAGWTHVKDCNCNGMFQHVLKLGMYSMRIFPNQNYFAMDPGSGYVTRYELNQLQSKLNEINTHSPV